MEGMEINLFSSSSKNICNTIRKRYVLALSIIIFLLILSQVIIQININNESGDSRVINISGRQRMLSQKISKAAYGIFISTDAKTRALYIKELKDSTDLWKKSHYDLKNGNKAEGLPGNNSKKVMELYSNIELPHKTIMNAAYDIVSMVQSNQYDKSLLWSKIQIIQDNEQVFLNGMNAIVFQYDAESKAKINLIKKIELSLLFLTLTTIVLEAFFIFLPAEKSISKAFTELKESTENLQKIFETAPAAMLIINGSDLSVMLKNKFAVEIIGKTNSNIDSLKLDSIFDSVSNKSSDFIAKIKNNEKIENYEATISIENIKKIVLISSTKIYFDNKASILLGLTDITKHKQEEESLKRLATYDGLTGLVNRRSGWLILENTFDQAKAGIIDFSICFIDIDNLKHVNDSFGHDEGDWYIKTIAEVLKKNVRHTDCVFRYGGDEIIILLHECDTKNGEIVMSKVEATLNEIQISQNKPYSLIISYGIVNYKSYNADTLDNYIRYADQLMYKNKKSKKDKK
jgi:diguanylate cyclase (GGDEF) domain